MSSTSTSTSSTLKDAVVKYAPIAVGLGVACWVANKLLRSKEAKEAKEVEQDDAGSSKVEKVVTLRSYQVELLQAAVSDYKLPSLSKAVRTLVQYCQQDIEPKFAFKKRRCMACSNKKRRRNRSKMYETLSVTLYDHQWEWLEQQREAFGVKDSSKMLRCALDMVEAGDADKEVVFNKVRCKATESCEHCKNNAD